MQLHLTSNTTVMYQLQLCCIVMQLHCIMYIKYSYNYYLASNTVLYIWIRCRGTARKTFCRFGFRGLPM